MCNVDYECNAGCVTVAECVFVLSELKGVALFLFVMQIFECWICVQNNIQNSQSLNGSNTNFT